MAAAGPAVLSPVSVTAYSSSLFSNNLTKRSKRFTNMVKKLFPSQLDTETVFLVVREHWARFAVRVIFWTIFAIPLLLFDAYVPTLQPDWFVGTSGSLITITTHIYALFLLLSFFIFVLLHYINMEVITDLRIVQISQDGLFSHTVAELHIDKIEDVTSEVDGFLGTMFDYDCRYQRTF